MPSLPTSPAAAQQPEAVIQPGQDLGGRERPHARGGQFDRQRDPVQARTDFRNDTSGRVIEREFTTRHGRSFGEQPHGVCGRVQRRDAAYELAGHAQWLPAGGQDRCRRCVRHDGRHQRRRVVEDVLAVVDDEQCWSCS
jgi:hypothetical protein